MASGSRTSGLIAGMFSAQENRPAHLGEVDLATLTRFQRGMLVMVGLVTQYIESQTLEPIRVLTLSQETRFLPCADSWLDASEGAGVVSRRVLLVGENSAANYLYGEALLAPWRLSDDVRQDLTKSNVGLGRVLRRRKVEIYGELLWFGLEETSELHQAVDHWADRPLISRTYRFISAGRPVALITERFPLEEPVATVE